VNVLKTTDEITWLSFFKSEPQLLDEGIPYYYNEAKYQFENKNNERFIVTIAPSYSEFKIEIYKGDTNEQLGILDFKNIESIDILSNWKEEKRIMITNPNSIIKIDFSPRYKVFFNQNLVY